MPTTVVELYRRVKYALLRTILSDKVGPFVWIYYIPLWIFSISNTVLFWPTYVEKVMGVTVYIVWNAVMIIGTTVVMAGIHFEGQINQGKRAHITSFRDMLGYTGIHLQAGGHGCMFFVLFIYLLCSIQVVHWGEPANFNIVLISPYVIGCFLLTIQASVKIFATEAIKNQLARNGPINK